MIGSETFIIVAFRCRENSTPWALASSICSAMNAASALRDMRAASTISPSCTFTGSRSARVLPSAPTNSIFSSPALPMVAERSLP